MRSPRKPTVEDEEIVAYFRSSAEDTEAIDREEFLTLGRIYQLKARQNAAYASAALKERKGK